jgi:alcohol dehydrogenase (cytochrome c)
MELPAQRRERVRALLVHAIVVNGVVYFQDLNSNVFALDRNTGALKWEHRFNRPSVGPNGVSFGYGRLYAATETQAFALAPQTGHLIWKSRKLPRNGNGQST